MLGEAMPVSSGQGMHLVAMICRLGSACLPVWLLVPCGQEQPQSGAQGARAAGASALVSGLACHLPLLVVVLTWLRRVRKVAALPVLVAACRSHVVSQALGVPVQAACIAIAPSACCRSSCSRLLRRLGGERLL